MSTIARLRELVAKATPGPWHFDGVAQIVEANRPHMRHHSDAFSIDWGGKEIAEPASAKR